MIITAPPILMPSPRFLPTIQDLGQKSGLQMCYDVADIRSYDGTSQVWTDQMGNLSINRGATNGAEASDPTFNGTAGELGAYWSFDGGDYFQIPNSTFTQSFHKNNALFSIAGWVYLTDVTSANQIFVGNNNISGLGIYWGYVTTNNVGFAARHGSGLALSANHGGTIALNTWTFVAIAQDESIGASGLSLAVNDDIDLFTSTYTTPSASDAAAHINFGAFGGGGTVAYTNGGRMACMAFWDRKLTDAELLRLYNRTRRRFGV